ncbi:putative N-acetyltransferase YhbS [Rhizobium tibeticum]|uniref:GNAT family N-acetyltransferase n=1 Tax=Rhizobium tibeticum TaxID=501024 RepID=UPI002787D886|nr:GNAT family N-acetyltransferase [Rhizobium tibeticum]MDP9813950.1 putative N-acetyltransferase YhbS [Rhizobium tibeticum]
MQVSDYRECQVFGPIIADRIWNAWWKDAGLHLSDVTHHLTEMGDDRPLPSALVAHDDSGYLGSAFLIDCDMEQRKQYKPWIAALWVEETARNRGIGRALVERASKAAVDLGYDVSYICCHNDLEDFYTAFGWKVIERGAGPHNLSVLVFT